MPKHVSRKKAKSKRKKKSCVKPNGKKDYKYRGTWQHKLSRAKNKAKRGGLTKKAMMEQYGRFPRRKEWWGPEENEKEWKKKWIQDNPQYKGSTTKKKKKKNQTQEIDINDDIDSDVSVPCSKSNKHYIKKANQRRTDNSPYKKTITKNQPQKVGNPNRFAFRFKKIDENDDSDISVHAV
eukprot:189951_1